jgi:hypothetical protein
MWPPASVHFTVQAGAKLVEPSGDSAPLYPLAWIAGCALIPLFVYAAPLARDKG